jgi:acylaminoacyl-peptidase
MPLSTKPFRPADALKQTLIHGLAISPDGETLVYARRTIEKGQYRSRLWRVPFTGGRPEQLTFADANDGQPRFSPDGSTLSFISDRSEKPQAWIMPVDGGEPRMIAEMPDGAGVAEWSPDGTRLLLLAGSGEERFVVGEKDDPVARQIRDYVWRVDGMGVRDQNTSVWIAPANGRGKPARVTRPAFDVSLAVWSPDGSRIGFLADTRPDRATWELTQAWSVPSSGTQKNAKERSLAALDGGVWGMAWGPGGLAVVGIDRADPHGWERQVLFLAERGGLRRLDDDMGDRTVSLVTYGDLVDTSSTFGALIAWVDDRTIVGLVSDRGRSLPHRFDVDGSSTPLAEGDLVCTALAAAEGRVAVVANVDSDAGEVYAVEDAALRRVTTNGSRWFAPFRRVPERLEARHRDGHTVEGWLLRARGHRKAPLVVQVHGGPHAAHNPTPWMEMLALADAGFHVVWANPRGSTSYGEPFARAIDAAWGDADASDLLLMVDRIVSMGVADRKRVGILGLSYGGFMVHWLLGHFPGRFAAGVSENPVTDLIADFGNSDFGSDIGVLAAGSALPSDSFTAWIERSPYSNIHLNEAPLLLLQCEDDLRCPPVNSEIPFVIMKTLGREVEMVRYPGESHVMFVIGRPDRRVDRMERIVAWFTDHL